MAVGSFLSHFPFIAIIIFLAIIPLLNGENANYRACSILYSCGQIQNVGYPFWGDNRPKYCGVPDFKLNCNNLTSKSSTTMNVFQNGHLELRVVGINTYSHTMLVSPDLQLDTCYLNHTSNITLLSSLKPNAPNIHLFYGCADCASRYSSKFFYCSGYYDGTNGTAYYFNKTLGMNRITNSCSCKNNITFWVDKKGLDELRHSNASLRSILTERPIVTKYTVDFKACFNCVKSGGRCGSSGNQSQDQFVCYCKDGFRPLVCPTSEKKSLRLLLGLGIAGVVLLVVAVIAIWHCKKQKSVIWSSSLDCDASELEKGSKLYGVPLFSYCELTEATANFDQSKELGSGGFGIVYYGKLKDGREVAIKRLYEKSHRRVEQFMNEVQILTRLRHQNLLSLYGCTSHHCRELLLVYEYARYGTLADHLYGTNTHSGSLPWSIRMRCAIEIAAALSYLHASDIVHRDVKTNNILLDSNLCVKVADFGLSRLFPTDVTHVSTAPQGTPGYLDPEYHQCYQLTGKSDVYSFGVVLIELISSLPAIDMDRHKHEINLSNYAINRIQRCAFDELVDPQLGFALDFKVRRMTTAVAELAFQCLQHHKEFRPSMDEVIEVLKGIESIDYEALQAEEMPRNSGVEVMQMETNNPPLSPPEDDHALLLSNRRLYSSSPISVMHKWVSRSTTPSISK